MPTGATYENEEERELFEGTVDGFALAAGGVDDELPVPPFLVGKPGASEVGPRLCFIQMF